MSYVRYQHSFYRNGFRPYGRTNPRAATQLSGVFNAEGGARLRGLGSLGDVPDQTVLAYTGTWTSGHGQGQDPNSILAAVSAALAGDGINVLNGSVKASFMQNTTAGGFALGAGAFTVNMTLQVNNGMGFAQVTDVDSIVQHEVYVATGVMPGPGGYRVVQAGSSADDSTDWSSWLQDNALYIGGFLALVIVGPALIKEVL